MRINWLLSLLFVSLLISFSCLVMLATISTTALSKSSESGLISDLRKMLLVVIYFIIMLL